MPTLRPRFTTHSSGILNILSKNEFPFDNLTTTSAKSKEETGSTVLEKKFEAFISSAIINRIQNSISNDLIAVLIRVIGEYSNIAFSQSVYENEIVFNCRTSKGYSIIVIDEDGDIMVSFSPFYGQGWRKFYSLNEIDLETIVYTFLK